MVKVTTAKRTKKRDSIVKAATEVFLERGFSGASMDYIAEVAKASKRTVYNYFPSKDDLFQAIVNEILDRVEEMPRHDYSRDRDLEEQLIEIGETFTETITDPEFMKLSRVVVSRFIQAPSWAHNTMKAYSRLRRDMTAYFKAGTEDGRLQIEDPDQAASQFCGLIKEIAYWPELMAGQAPLSPEERDKTIRSAVKIFLGHYQVKG